MTLIKRIVVFFLIALFSSALVFFMLKFIMPFNTNPIDNISLDIVEEKITQNKKLIVYFGSLKCQDTLSKVFSSIRKAKDKLSILDNNKFDIVFVDTQKDDKNEVQSYLEYFIPTAKSILVNNDELLKIKNNNHIFVCTKSLYFFKNINNMHKILDLYNKDISLHQEISEFIN